MITPKNTLFSHSDMKSTFNRNKFQGRRSAAEGRLRLSGVLPMDLRGISGWPPALPAQTTQVSNPSRSHVAYKLFQIKSFRFQRRYTRRFVFMAGVAYSSFKSFVSFLAFALSFSFYFFLSFYLAGERENVMEAISKTQKQDAS